MRTWKLNRRVEDLSEKLKDTTVGSIIHIDFESFSEAEKLVFRKVDEIGEKYRQTGSEDVLRENGDLISKNLEIVFRRVTELYSYVVPMVLGCGDNFEIVEFFFKLHFRNFEADLAECLANLRRWSEKDREDFHLILKQHGSMFPRIPRGFNERNTLKRKKRERKSNV